jgi:hypothetical protein
MKMLNVKTGLLAVLAAVVCSTGTYAQSEQILRPSRDFPWERDVPSLEYVSGGNLHLKWWDSVRDFPVEFPEFWQFSHSFDAPIQALKFEPIEGGQAITLPVLGVPGVASPTERLQSLCQSGLGMFGRRAVVRVDARQFGVTTTTSKTFRVTPVGIHNENAESIVVSFNFRSYSQPIVLQEGQPMLNSIRNISSSYWLMGRFDNRLVVQFAGVQKPLKGLRLRPTTGGKAYFLQIPANQQSIGGNSGFLTTEFNGADLNLAANSQTTFDLTLVAENNLESVPFRLTLNSKMTNQFQQSLADLRAQEIISSVLPIQFNQSIGNGGLSVYSLENFQTYARVRVALRSQFSSTTDRNLVLTAIAEGFIQISDDLGNAYPVQADVTRDGQCGMRPIYNGTDFSLLLGAPLNQAAQSLVLKFQATPEAAARLAEPFKSGFRVVLPLRR